MKKRGGGQPYPGCTDDLSEIDVHPVVTTHQMAIVCFSIFEFHQLEREVMISVKGINGLKANILT